jgi:F-type H+-transporting ATPase subunit b
MGKILTHIQGGLRPVLAAAFLAVLGFAPLHAAEAPNQPELEPSITINDTSATDAHDVTAAGHETAAGEEHGKSGGLPQLDFTTYTPQLFWMAIIFLALYVVMAKKALPAIGSTVEGRRDLIDGNLKSAEQMRAEAATIQAAYEKNLEQARAEAMKAVQDVEDAAAKKLAEQTEAFRKKSEAAINAAEDNVSVAKNNAMAQMTGVAAEVASIAAEKITGVSTDRQNAQAIVETIAGKAKAA